MKRSLTLGYAVFRKSSDALDHAMQFGYLEVSPHVTIRGTHGVVTLLAPSGKTDHLHIPKGGRLEVWDAS